MLTTIPASTKKKIIKVSLIYFGKNEYKIRFKKIIYILKEKNVLSVLLKKDAKPDNSILIVIIYRNLHYFT